MPDEERDRTDEDVTPDTSLHAYAEGREEDVEGNLDKLKSGDPKDSQRGEISEGSEESSFPEHPKS